MQYSKPELTCVDPIGAIRQSISAKPTLTTTDMNPGHTEKTTVNAYEADE